MRTVIIKMAFNQNNFMLKWNCKSYYGTIFTYSNIFYLVHEEKDEDIKNND